MLYFIPWHEIYESMFPWWAGTVLWMVGLGLLSLTRLNSRLEPRLGSGYYVLSSVLRPLGIALISFGWLEVSGHQSKLFPTNLELVLSFGLGVSFIVVGYLIHRTAAVVFISLAILFSMASSNVAFVFLVLAVFWGFAMFGLWAVFKLGIRQSFLFRKSGDPLVTDGPYALSRHPQLFSALMMTWSACFVLLMDGPVLMMLNFLLFAASVWLVIKLEEKDLVAQLGDSYRVYQKSLPMLTPRLIKTRIACKKCDGEAPAGTKLCPACGAKIKKTRDAHGCFIIILLPALAAAFVSFIYMPKGGPFIIGVRQSEAKTNLRSLMIHQLAYHGENNFFGPDFKSIEWAPEGIVQYSYCMGEGRLFPTPGYVSEKDEALINAYMEEHCPPAIKRDDAGFTAMAVGNIDRDEELDVWIINNLRELKNLERD